MAWSFVCPTEVRAFSQRIQEFQARGTAVAFASTDSEFVLRAWDASSTDEGGLGGVNVPLLSDRSHKLSRDYGVLIDGEGVAQRALFIIDPKGMVRLASVHDVNVGRSVDEVRRLMDALLFTDEFGEGCPADWQKGDAGTKLEKFGRAPRKTTVPKRPAMHSRQNTWSGWLASKSPRSQSVISHLAPTSRKGSLDKGQVQEQVNGTASNSSAVVNNGKALLKSFFVSESKKP